METVLTQFISLFTFMLSLSFSAQAQITVQEFRMIAQIFHAEYDAEIQKQNAKLFINNPPTPDNPDFWYNLETVRAAMSRVRPRIGRGSVQTS